MIFEWLEEDLWIGEVPVFGAEEVVYRERWKERASQIYYLVENFKNR
jgi:hypothetical protein